KLKLKGECLYKYNIFFKNGTVLYNGTILYNLTKINKFIIIIIIIIIINKLVVKEVLLNFNYYKITVYKYVVKFI
ncbi:MAG: hypothetical protein N7Q72_04325, partial [Spiroplasma sp. Tabriz.8]|nr:hypothetical protein [Candidatus Regiella insecticola]MCX2959623.1 hypothetical protein [Serratia symbiotica]MCZ8632472.1 hypothetical protein [Spiroplasma sp. Tabriz.8]